MPQPRTTEGAFQPFLSTRETLRIPEMPRNHGTTALGPARPYQRPAVRLSAATSGHDGPTTDCARRGAARTRCRAQLAWQRGVAGQPMCAAVCPRRPEAPNFNANEKLPAPIPTPAGVHTEYSCSNGHADWFPRSFRGFCRKSPDLRILRSFF